MDSIVQELNDLNKTDTRNCSGQLCQEPADTDMDSHSGEAESREVSAPVAGPTEDPSGGIEAMRRQYSMNDTSLYWVLYVFAFHISMQSGKKSIYSNHPWCRQPLQKRKVQPIPLFRCLTHGKIRNCFWNFPAVKRMRFPVKLLKHRCKSSLMKILTDQLATLLLRNLHSILPAMWNGYHSCKVHPFLQLLFEIDLR